MFPYTINQETLEYIQGHKTRYINLFLNHTIEVYYV